jgi:tRNA dimethylallyltransferase
VTVGAPQLAPTPVIALFGATGLGKTEIAVALAAHLGGEIVSADSMQVYQGLPIVTNQPTREQCASVRHHLVSFVDPREEYSVAAYARDAHAAIDDILARGRPAVVEGGSGLYLRAALGALEFGVAPDVAERAALERQASADVSVLVTELDRRDPDTARAIDVRNTRRVVRALETVRRQGAPLADAQRARLWQRPERYPHVLFSLEPARTTLSARVDARVDAMISSGLVAEIRDVLTLGRPSRTVMQAIGVREIAAALTDEISFDEAIALMKNRTRRYVRRQLTWMRKLPDAARIAVAGRSPGDVAAEIVRRLPNTRGCP